MRNNRIALDMIEARFRMIEAGDTSAIVHAELGMAIEMAHSLGAISLEEYTPLARRHNAIYDKQANQASKKLERLAKPVSIGINFDTGKYSLMVSKEL